ncbi:MAG: hypothetical protein IPK17_30685 [Chloroflexi bacterium]|uniref:hypothetical protein n=1 Tax=Candidatus Flexifilum breve TaxID=3140694 RepID=UPI0031352DFB|nr:hypothetical protein [Chloroflexota bacterium]
MGADMLVKQYFESEMQQYLEEVFTEIDDRTVVFETQDDDIRIESAQRSPCDKYGYIGSIYPEEYFAWNWQRFRCLDQRTVDVVFLENTNILVVRKGGIPGRIQTKQAEMISGH